jgi:hypothetical protein
MNGYRSSAKPFSERELGLQRVSDFHAVLLGMAAHDLRQPLQVIQNTYEWLNGSMPRPIGRGCSEASGRSPESPSNLISWLQRCTFTNTRRRWSYHRFHSHRFSTAWEPKMLSSPGKKGSSCVSGQPAQPS